MSDLLGLQSLAALFSKKSVPTLEEFLAAAALFCSADVPFDAAETVEVAARRLAVALGVANAGARCAALAAVLAVKEQDVDVAEHAMMVTSSVLVTVLGSDGERAALQGISREDVLQGMAGALLALLRLSCVRGTADAATVMHACCSPDWSDGLRSLLEQRS